MTFIESLRKAEKLIKSKQNRENKLALIGIDVSGNEHFIDWVSKDSVLYLPRNMVDITVKAGTCG